MRWMARISLGWKDGKRQAKEECCTGATQERGGETAPHEHSSIATSGKNIDDRAVPAYRCVSAARMARDRSDRR